MMISLKEISKAMTSTHYAWGMAALAALAVTGVAALVELVRSGGRRESTAGFSIVLGLGVFSLAMMIVAGGWEINHHELQSVTFIPM